MENLSSKTAELKYLITLKPLEVIFPTSLLTTLDLMETVTDDSEEVYTEILAAIRLNDKNINQLELDVKTSNKQGEPKLVPAANTN